MSMGIKFKEDPNSNFVNDVIDILNDVRKNIKKLDRMISILINPVIIANARYGIRDEIC